MDALPLPVIVMPASLTSAEFDALRASIETALRAYGAACAAAERERCMDAAKALANNMRTDIDLRWQHGYRAACADLYNALRYEALPYVD